MLDLHPTLPEALASMGNMRMDKCAPPLPSYVLNRWSVVRRVRDTRPLQNFNIMNLKLFTMYRAGQEWALGCVNLASRLPPAA